MKTKYKHIHFVELPKKPMRVVWQCLNNRDKEVLCVITFYKTWKQHVAQFDGGCVFNDQCLKDIADFLGQLNREAEMSEKLKVGDKGQRYQVLCLDSDNKKLVVGWSETLTGALSFCKGVRSHPAHHNPEILDRKPK